MDTQTPDTGKQQPRPQVAVWFFVGATFAFSWGSGLMPGMETRTPKSWVLLGAGLVAIVAGMFVLARELREAKKEGVATERD